MVIDFDFEKDPKHAVGVLIVQKMSNDEDGGIRTAKQYLWDLLRCVLYCR